MTKVLKTVGRILLTAMCAVLAAGLLTVTVWGLMCAGDPEGFMGRYSPYTEEEILTILEAEYGGEFELLSSEDSGDRITYAVCPEKLPELRFLFVDYSDGFAGWYAYDNYGDSVLGYCAEKCGIDADFSQNDMLEKLSVDAGSAAENAEALKDCFDMYFGIFDRCRGELRRYSSYHPRCEGRHVNFALKAGAYENRYVTVCEAGFSDRYSVADTVFTDDMSAENIEDILSDIVRYDIEINLPV